MDGVNYYQLFSLSPSATPDELKSQYRRLSLQYHPDRGGTTEQMSQLNEAYRVLSNPLLRREYDRKRVAQELVTDNSYHYTRPQPRPASAAAVTPQKNHFWQWFTVLAVLGLALITYDVMTTWVLPRYVRESSASAASDNLTPSGDLTDEAASALSEFQNAQSNPTQTPSRSTPAQVTPAPTPSSPETSPQTNTSEQPTARSSWRERMRQRDHLLE